MRLIDDKYVEDPDVSELTEGAISGMLNKLDPHSIYINKGDYQQTDEDMKGEFEGIGVEFSIIDDYITVISPIIDGPSYKACIQAFEHHQKGASIHHRQLGAKLVPSCGQKSSWRHPREKNGASNRCWNFVILKEALRGHPAIRVRRQVWTP